MEGSNEARHDNRSAASTIDANGLFGGRSSNSADQDALLRKYSDVAMRMGRSMRVTNSALAKLTVSVVVLRH